MKKLFAGICFCAFVGSVYAQTGGGNSNFVTGSEETDNALFEEAEPIVVDPLAGLELPLIVYFGPDEIDFPKSGYLPPELAAANEAVFNLVIAFFE